MIHFYAVTTYYRIMVAVNYIQKHCSKLLRLYSLIVNLVFKNKKLGTGDKKQWQFMIISQALKLQGDFNRTVKIVMKKLVVLIKKAIQLL